MTAFSQDIYGYSDIYAVGDVYNSGSAISVFPDGGPVWANVRAWGTQVEQALDDAANLTLTSSYTLLVTDESEIIFLSGGFNTLTVGAPGGYSALRNNIIANIGNRAWLINISGIAPFKLWPTQTFMLTRQGGGAWNVVNKTRRWRQPNFVTLYVAPSGGSVNNDGLGPDAPFDTMTNALTTAADQFDLAFGAQPGILIQLLDGVHTSGLILSGSFWHAAGNFSIQIQGNTSNPNAVTIADPAAPAMQLFNKVWVLINDMVLTGFGAAIAASNESSFRLEGGITFGAVTGGGPHISLLFGSKCIADNDYNISGNARYHVQAASFSEYTAGGATGQITVNFTTNCGFGANFGWASDFSTINFQPVLFKLNGFKVAGNRYNIIRESLLQVHGTSGDNLPGSSSGTIDATSTILFDGANYVLPTIATFPALLGLGFDVVRSELWSTTVQENISGKQVATGYWSFPKYQWELTYDFLRGNLAFSEWQQLQSFFALMSGRLTSFLYQDADDGQAVNQVIGFGDGVKTQFQLIRTLGTFEEAILAANLDSAGPAGIAPAVFIDGVRTVAWSYGIYGSTAPGVVSFAAAPAAGALITATFSYWWPVRFDDDKMTFNKFMSQLWTNKKVTFTTVKQ